VAFQEPVRRSIHGLKYYSRRDQASVLADLMIPMWERERPDVQVAVPIPLHQKRHRERGFNQSAWLTLEFAKRVGIPTQPEALTRIRATAPQVGLSPHERRQNVKDAFQGDAQIVRGRSVLLIDDVCTTGSTLRSAAAALHKAGAVHIWAFTVARAVQGDDRSQVSSEGT
jgi:ComF family protein